MMDNSSRILAHVDGQIGTLTFNNPERHNAMSLEMWRDAATVLDQFAANQDVRVVVLTGAGGKAFVSGADISKFESERGSKEAVAIYGAAVEHLQQILINHPKPTVAMIRGYCVGGGVNIAIACDMRICNESGRFGIPAAKLGLGYGRSSLRLLLDLVSPQYVYELLFTARHVDAGEASHMGLVNRVVPDGEIEAYVRGLSETMAGNAPLTIRAAKRTVRELLADTRNANDSASEHLVQQCFDSADYQEGRRAFLEKRKPVFTGA
jgi:enoyl-CoA hydratase/carnithine racemase